MLQCGEIMAVYWLQNIVAKKIPSKIQWKKVCNRKYSQKKRSIQKCSSQSYSVVVNWGKLGSEYNCIY